MGIVGRLFLAVDVKYVWWIGFSITTDVQRDTSKGYGTKTIRIPLGMNLCVVMMPDVAYSTGVRNDSR